jgi:hypothetical protein
MITVMAQKARVPQLGRRRISVARRVGKSLLPSRERRAGLSGNGVDLWYKPFYR